MRKRISALLAIVLIFVPSIVLAQEELLESYTEFYSDVFADGVEKLDDTEGFELLLADASWKDLLDGLVKGKIELSFSSVTRELVAYFFQEVIAGLKMMMLLIALCVLTSYLVGMKDGFGSEGVGMAAFYVCYVIISGIATAVFFQVATCVGQTVEQIALFMKMIVPVVMTALITCGAIVSATVFEPVVVTIVEVAVNLIQNVMIPLVMIATGLSIVNHLSDRFKTQKLTKFMNQTVKWGLSVMLTVFVSVAGLQSIASSGADALTVRLSKFAAANLIPVVGGILSESVETVMNCSVLIKNSIGILGIISLAVLTLLPLIKIGAILILFRLTAAVCEPVAEPKVIQCMSELGNSISVLFSILVAVTVMFIMIVTIVMNAGNTAVMLGR